MGYSNDLPASFIGKVFAHKLHFITTILTKNGISLSSLLKGTEIEPHDLNDSGYKIHKEQIITFYRNILALQIPGVNILLGDSIKPNDYGLYGCTLLCSKGLKAALKFAIRYHNLTTKTVCMTLHVDEKSDFSYIRFEDLLLTPDLVQFNVELQCIIVLSLARECLDNNVFYFDQLRFSFDRPKHYHLYDEYFQCPISYNNSHNEFVLTNDKLLLNIPRSNPFAMPLLLDQCDMVLNSISTKNEFLISIHEWVAANMHKEINSQELADYLCITPRTLRRKLAVQGTSFRDIVQGLRCEAAKKLLLETQLTIEDIAYSIGFNDASNFGAAFKKWTGLAPSSVR